MGTARQAGETRDCVLRNRGVENAHGQLLCLQPARHLPADTALDELAVGVGQRIAEGQIDQLGDTSTLAEPDVVEKLVQGRQ